MTEPLGCVAVSVVTWEGVSLAVGGICLFKAEYHWAKRFYTLSDLSIPDCDIFTMDYTVAKTLQSLADESLLLVGCSFNVRRDLPLGVSTGGVLGSPHVDIKSAQNSIERLPQGFSLYTLTGGPGLAALADFRTTKKMVQAVNLLNPDASIRNIFECLTAFGVETYIYVSDGTGTRTNGSLIVSSPGKSYILSNCGCRFSN